MRISKRVKAAACFVAAACTALVIAGQPAAAQDYYSNGSNWLGEMQQSWSAFQGGPVVDGVKATITIPWVDNQCNDSQGRSQLAMFISQGALPWQQIGFSLNPNASIKQIEGGGPYEQNVITGAWLEMWDDNGNELVHEWGVKDANGNSFNASAGDRVQLRMQWGPEHNSLYLQWKNLTTGQNIVINNWLNGSTDQHGSYFPGNNVNDEISVSGEAAGSYPYTVPIVHFDGSPTFDGSPVVIQNTFETSANSPLSFNSDGMPEATNVMGMNRSTPNMPNFWSEAFSLTNPTNDTNHPTVARVDHIGTPDNSTAQWYFQHCGLDGQL